MSEIKVMNDDEIRDFCIKKDLKIFELEQEIERLNNIINELEKELKNRIKNVPDTMVEVYEDESILNKLQELKREDKE